MKSGIYLILSPSGKKYIGQSKDIFYRWKRYRQFNGKIRTQVKLEHSFLKYTVDAHKFYIITYCDIELLNTLEVYYANKYEVYGENGLNIRQCGKSGGLSEETKNKISIKAKMRGAKPPSSKGVKRSQETINRMRESRIGIKLPPQTKEQKEKISNTLLGHSVSQEIRDKISKSLMGKPSKNKGRIMPESFRIMRSKMMLGIKRGKYKPREPKLCQP